MRQSVKDIFFDFSVGHEGFTPFPYADILNLVTTGIGNKIDNGKTCLPNGLKAVQCARLNNVVSAAAMEPALRLPWKQRAPGWTSKNPLAGDLVSPSEVSDAWIKVKRQNEVVPDFSQRGGGSYAGLTDITLDMDGLKTLFSSTLTDFENKIRGRNPNWESWPADAQLAVLSMAWAMGPYFTDKFKAMKIALDRGDFASAGAQSHFIGGDTAPTGKLSRNQENVIMFKNAADAVKGGADLSQLFFPGTSVTSTKIFPSAATVIGPSITDRAIQIGKPVAAAGLIGAVGYGLYELAKEKGWI
jgi:hypothetical protein